MFPIVVFSVSPDLLVLLSFPTRRSSDLSVRRRILVCRRRNGFSGSHHRVSRKGIFLPFHAAQRSARQPFLPAARGERLPRRADSRTRRLGKGESHRESGVARWPRRDTRDGLPPALRACL